MNMNKRQEFYDVLFNRGEGIAYQTDHGVKGTDTFYKTNKVLVHKGDQDDWRFDYQFYCINPIDHETDNCHVEGEEFKPRAKICNVTSYRNFAIEFDDDSIEEQSKKIKLAKPPVSAIIFSGSRSLHTPIALEEEVTFEEYSAIYEAIKQTLLKHDLKLDKQCKNANRLTRAPYQKRHESGVEQKLISLKGRIPNQVLFDWFEANDINWKDYIYKPKNTTHVYEGAGDADDTERWLAAVSGCKHFHGTYESAEQWQPWVYELGKWCKAYGLSEDVAVAWANRDYDHPETNAITSGIKNAYKYSNMSPKTLNKPKVIKEDSSMFDNLLDDIKDVKPNRPKIPYDNLIENWWMIGSDIYLRYPNRELEKQTVQGFNARFPQKEISYTMIPNVRSGMGYYPDYFGDNDLPLEGNKYNQFKKPSIKLERGEWPMTKILLNHIFGDQYEKGLEYYWVKRHRPKQALPALCLIGNEDSGKSTVGYHQDLCFGNSVTIGIKHLEGSDSAFLFGHQDIIIEESNAGGSNKMSNADAILSDIKTMVTQCGKKIPCKRLHKDVSLVDYFAKILMFTNDKTPIKMTGEATRFWVRYIGSTEKHDDFLEHLEDEVGHFLWYLDNEYKPSREVSKERLWFHPDEYWTIAKDLAKKHSGSSQAKAIKDALVQWFSENDEEVCYFDQKSIKDYIESEFDYQFTKGDIKDALLDELGWPLNKRLSRTDSLSEPVNGLRVARKMSYWAIDSHLLPYDEDKSMDKLLEL